MFDAYVEGWQNAFVWVIVLAFLFAFVLSFSQGANGCANTFGPSYGSKVLKLWEVFVIASIFESLGALLLGYNVIETIRGGIVNLDIYTIRVEQFANGTVTIVNDCYTNLSVNGSSCAEYTSAQYLVGTLGSVIACALWLVIATVLKLPVSTTHAVVGATVGFSLVLRGNNGINWWMILKIAISWIASPLIAGVFAALFYFMVANFVFNKKDQLEASLKLMPFAFFVVAAINGFSIFYDGSKFLGFDKIPWWGDVVLSLVVGVVAAICAQVFAIDRIRRWVLSSKAAAGYGAISHAESYASVSRPKKNEESARNTLDRSDSDTESTGRLVPRDVDVKEEVQGCCSRRVAVVEHEDTRKVFAALQILSACFLSFSHGTNGTSSAIGPLAGAWLVYAHGYVMYDAFDYELELLILFGVFAVIVGLCCFGRKVMAVAKNINNEITPCSAFCMQLGTAFTLLFASKVGIPISTTHALVGTFVLVGWYRSGTADVSWRTFRGVALAWVVTLPVTGLLSALLTWLLNFALVSME